MKNQATIKSLTNKILGGIPVSLVDVISALGAKKIVVVNVSNTDEVLNAIKEKLFAFDSSLNILTGAGSRYKDGGIKIAFKLQQLNLSMKDLVTADLSLYINENNEIRTLRCREFPAYSKFIL